MIENYFSVPMYFTDCQSQEIRHELQTVVDDLKFENFWQRDNDTAKTTFKSQVETNIIKSKNLFKTEKFIVHEAEKYLNSTKNFVEENSVSIENSWMNLFNENDSIGWHDHGYQPNTCSGVFYLSAPIDCGKILFKSPNPYTITFPNRSDNYSNIISCAVRDNMLILFPSWLSHKVEPNRTKEIRISLSFNISFVYR